jgi:membrane associated rhomboid family serine protease/Zn-finger nucleic acid-binding protein
MRLETARRLRLWSCSRCHSAAGTLASLRPFDEGRQLREAWLQARQQPARDGRSCPSCTKPMHLVTAHGRDGAAIVLDICTSCHLVWFDAGEPPRLLASLPVAEPDPLAKLGPAERQALGRAEAQLAERLRSAYLEEFEPPQGWRRALASVGLPWLDDVDPVEVHPVVTWGLAGLVAVTSAFGLLDLAATHTLALQPGAPWRWLGLPFLACCFVHASWPDLAANLYLLLLLGCGAEEALGRRRYVGLLASGALASGLVHVLAAGHGAPLAGAGGCLSALLAFYLLRFPHARLGIMPLEVGPVAVALRLPIVALLALWPAAQLLLSLMQPAALGRLSVIGHLGGAAAGVALWVVLARAEAVARASRA